MAAPSGNPLAQVQFSGLAARAHPHLVPMDKALSASNCITDDDAVTGRPGTRAVTASAIASLGLRQHAGRFRPSSSCARTVVVIAGEIWIVTDPSSETASDGSAFSLGVPGTSLGLAANWNTTANISGVAMDNNYYLGTDQGENMAVRIVWDGLGCANSNFSLQGMASIPAGLVPTGSAASPTWVYYRPLTWVDSGVTRTNDSTAHWVIATPTSLGDSTYADLGVGGIDMSNADWLCVGVSATNGGTHKVSVWVAQDGGLNFVRLGATTDITTDGVGGSPDILYLDLTIIDPTERNAIRYVKFVDEGDVNPWLILGHLLIPSAPIFNPETYVVTFQNTSTLAESRPSSQLLVSITTGSLPVYDIRYYDAGITGSGTDSPISDTNTRIYNRQANIAMPLSSEIGQTVTITGTAPTLTGTGPFQVRLWKLVSNAGVNGYRLVASKTITTGAAYTLYDYGGDGVLANELLIPGGPMPAVNCLTARSQRLACMGTGKYANRVFISSFTATSDTTNPIPQFPDEANEDTDGWSFNISPAPNEVGLLMDGGGDALYLCTNEATYAMSDLTPDSIPWLVLRRGAVSRNAGGYFEDRFHWLSWDGIYIAVGKSQWQELSFDIRTYYQQTFLPDCHACIGYNVRERALYAFRDNLYLRYAYELSRWLPGTLSFPVRQCLSWNEQGVN